MAEAPAIGIDLGTTYSCVGVYRFGKVEIIANDQGNRTTPSYVAFTDDDRLIGDPAKDQAARNFNNTIFDVKRLIGRNYSDDAVQDDMKHWPFKVINDNSRPKIKVKIKGETETYFPEQISSMVLGKMKEIAEAYLGKSVKKAVITVPAYFNDSQRKATKDAATIAGLDVLRIINEPTAAAIAYGLKEKNASERKVLIFDLGGGTFDVSILNIKGGVIEVVSTAGDTHLGGEDFDNRMVNHFVQEFERKYKKDLSQNKKALRRLKAACERAKRTLSASSTASIDLESLHEGIDFYTSITRARFEKLNADLFRKMMKPVKKAIKDAGMDKDEMDEVVLVGGSSRIPKVQKLLQDFFDGKELHRSVNPDEAVAYGAAVQAAILHGDKSKEIKDVVLVDITPLSLGICVIGELMSVVVKRNTTIPVRITKRFYTSHDNQTSVSFEVFEGEFSETKYNNLLGEFKLIDIPQAPKGKVKMYATFNLDADGILNVSAIERKRSIQNEITISYNRNRLSQDEIEHMIEEAEEYRVREKKRKTMYATKNSLESYCINMKNTIVDKKLKNKIDRFDKDMILKKCDETICWSSQNELEETEEYERKLNELKSTFSLIISLAKKPEKKMEKYRKILNVKPGASQSEIHEAYRKAAVKYHPDKSKGDKDIASWMFRFVIAAKTFLFSER